VGTRKAMACSICVGSAPDSTATTAWRNISSKTQIPRPARTTRYRPARHRSTLEIWYTLGALERRFLLRLTHQPFCHRYPPTFTFTFLGQGGWSCPRCRHVCCCDSAICRVDHVHCNGTKNKVAPRRNGTKEKLNRPKQGLRSGNRRSTLDGKDGAGKADTPRRKSLGDEGKKLVARQLPPRTQQSRRVILL